MNDRRGIRTGKALVAIAVALTGGVAHGVAGCPVGTNCPGDPNGPGIHVGDKGSNCLRLTQAGDLRFCPESFENLPGQQSAPGGVNVKGRLWSGNKSMELTSHEVMVRLPDGTVTALLQVEVPPDAAGPSRLGFVYQPRGAAQPVHALGTGLEQLTLFFRLSTHAGGFMLELSFQETATPAGSGFQLYRYQGTYNNPDQDVSEPFCSLPASDPALPPEALPLSVLKGHRVNGRTGVITQSGSSITLACVSGAIATCLEEWEYQPWNPILLAAPESQPTLLLGACIQAKRAAYFAHPQYGNNDYRSYTKEGIDVRIQDDWLNTLPIANAGIEAIWDDKGAVCLNPANQRAAEDFVLQKLNPTALQALPACTPAHRQPGRLVTGKSAW